MRKYLNSLSGKYLLITLSVIIFWIIAGAMVANRINTSLHLNSIQQLLNENVNNSLKLEAKTQLLINLASSGKSPDEVSVSPEIQKADFKIITDLHTLLNDDFINQKLEYNSRIEMIIGVCRELKRLEDNYIELLREKGNTNSGYILNIQNLISGQSENLYTGMDPLFLPFIKESFRNYLISNKPDDLQSIILFVERSLMAAEQSNTEYPVNSNSAIYQLLKKLREVYGIDKKLGYYKENALTNELKLYSSQIREQMQYLNNDFHNYAQQSTRNALTGFILMLILLGLIISTITYLISSRMIRNLEQLTPALAKLSRGEVPAEIPRQEDSEIRKLTELTGQISENLKQKVFFVKNIINGSKEKNGQSFSPGDELGEALTGLQERFLIEEKKNNKRIEEERKRNWHNEGIAIFGEIFRSEREDIYKLSYDIIEELVKYLGASHGSMFIVNQDESEEVFYELAAAFAYDRRKFLEKRIYPGDGLTGTSALEKDTIFLSEVPEDYIRISSGMGEDKPAALLIVPLVYEKECMGIIEIASLSHIHEHEIEFVEKLSESIAITVFAVKNNIKTIELLQQSQLQAETMAMQEEKMRKNMEELERAQEESRKKEFEISGILNAINNSSMVAEYSLNGRIADINDKFSALLELGRDQILGKHHSEFSTRNKHEEDYKKFWNELKRGKTKFITEKFKLYSGKEIWLRQTFTPIVGKEGEILKILNIAYDVTETRRQQESLRKQADEITRKNMEMHSFSRAVDQSILKCEFSPEGEVISVNDNYCEITGLSQRELLGKNMKLFLRDREIDNFEAIMEQVGKGSNYSGVVRRTRPTGEEVWLMSNFSPVKDEKDMIYKVYFLAQDITEKKLKYQLLEEANKEIDRLKASLEKKKG